MDRVVGSATSQTNSSANHMAQQQHTGNQSKSAIIRASASMTNLMGMDLLPAVPKNSNQENCLKAQHRKNTGLVKASIKIGANKIALADATERCSSKDNLQRLLITAETTDLELKHTYNELNVKAFDPRQNSILQWVTELNLRNCANLTAGLLKALIAHCTSLKVLNLTGCQQLSHVDLIEIIPMLDGVESLDLSAFSQVNEEVAEKLPEMINLRHLVLSGCTGLTSKAFGELTQLRALVTLNLDGCAQLSNTELLTLKKLKHLRYLNVRNCPSITKHGIKALMDAMPWLKIVDSDFSAFVQKQQPHQGELPQAKKTRFG